MPKTVDTQQLNELVAGSKPVIVDYFAPWCGPCKGIEPALAALEQQLGDQAIVVKVDIDANRDAARAANIRSIPTPGVFRNGQQVAMKAGAMSKPALESFATPDVEA